MTKEEALKQFAYMGAVWFGNSKQHFAFSAYDRFNGWNKLADKWKEEAEEEWDEAEEVLNRLVELGCKPERQYLNYIDKLGYENFLIEMM